MKMGRADPFLKAVLVWITDNAKHSKTPTREMWVW